MLIKTDKLGIPRFSNRDLIDMIYSGHVDKIHAVLCDPSDEVTRFNNTMEEQGIVPLQKYFPLDIDIKTFDSICQSDWFMPEEYKTFDLIEFLNIRVSIYDLGYTKTPEYARVIEELGEYQQRNLIQLLRYIKYLVDFMHKNNIVWGVGRGSSVGSYVLFLIGIHRINSVKYNLSWREFLR